MKQITMKILLSAFSSFLLLISACDTSNPIISNGQTFQPVWQLQNQMPTSNDIYKSFWLTDYNAYAVGRAGTIIHTQDGGTNWERQNSGTSEVLNSIFFVDKNLGFAVGENRTILKTTNGGRSWVHQDIDSYGTFYDVYFWNENEGIIVGSPTMKTSDGGKNWNQISSGYSNHNQGKVTFINDTLGFAINYSDHGLYKTTDGGDNWVYISASGGFGSSIIDIMALKNNLIFLLSDAGFFKSTDQGTSWDTVSYGHYFGSSAFDVYKTTGSIYFADSLHGIIAAGSGTIYLTSDGGVSWEEQTIPTWYLMSSAYLSQTGKATVFGSYGTILSKENSSADWESFSDYANLTWYSDVVCLSEQDAIAVGNLGTISRTSDGGNTWEYISRDPLNSNNVGYQKLSFIDANDGVMLGRSVNNGQILKTTDGGYNWTQLIELYDTSFSDIQLLNDSVIIAVAVSNIYGSKPKIIKSVNGGILWIDISDSAMNYSNTNKINFINQDTGFVLCGNRLFKTTNGGFDWSMTDFTNGNSVTLTNIYFIDSQIGFLVGGNGLILKTEDGGTTWSDKSIVTNMISQILTIKFVDMNCGIVSNVNGRIFSTSNGGDSWTENNRLTDQMLQGVSVYNNFGLFVGYGGTILKADL